MLSEELTLRNYHYYWLLHTYGVPILDATTAKVTVQLRDHLLPVSGKTKSPRSQIPRWFSSTWYFPALNLRHPVNRADTSTHPISTPPQMSPLQVLLLDGDVETNPRLAPQCGTCRKSTTAKVELCCTCQKSIHQSSSGITRTMLKQCRQTNNYQCPNCRSVPRFSTANAESSSNSTTGQPAESATPQHISNAQP